MKKFYFLLFMLWCVLFLAGCGQQEAHRESGVQGAPADTESTGADGSASGQVEYYDIYAEPQTIFAWEESAEDSPLSDSGMRLCGMQFYQGEPVQLWEKYCYNDVGEYVYSDVYLYRADGSSELLWQTSLSFFYNLYLDEEGNGYCWGDTYKDGEGVLLEVECSTLVKYLANGEILFTREWEDGSSVEDICSLPDGRVYLIMEDARTRRLFTLDPDTGLTEEVKQVRLLSPFVGTQRIGAGSSTLLLYNDSLSTGKEIVELNPADGTENRVFSFEGTSYMPGYAYEMQQWDFRVPEDGSAEILYADFMGETAIWDRLQIKKVEKIPIVIRGGLATEGWIAGQAALFNAQSDTYHVIVESCKLDEWADYTRLTSVQIATGEGPDIVCGDLLEDYLAGMLEKGALEDLSPYIAESGIREEDYFPFTFNFWKEDGRVYGICPKFPGGSGAEIDEKVLGGRVEPDIHTLVDALLSRQEEAVYLSNYGSQRLLEVFFGGTETLWGAVDWEQGTCDFSGELFRNILEIAKRYGDDGRRGGLPSLAQDLDRSVSDIFYFHGPAEQEESGMVLVGVLFDDGCHLALSSFSALAINANSAHKEGAWEFICFLLSEDAQNFYAVNGGMPALKSAFDLLIDGQKEQVAGGKKFTIISTVVGANGAAGEQSVEVYGEEDITEEKIEAYRKMLEGACPYPIRTLPILDIIYEEAADYFNGSKSLDEVCGIMENRVQLYLNESR
ncbi:MAG: extracellular solute-binding protein [Lachnospiraceae bacterium]|nr:extracellular solute-binding protein [Lachnospiraceae bacterium]